ncbi:MAG: pseudouridine-5'-phosphate glycosidase [Chloroflexota bacterium]
MNLHFSETVQIARDTNKPIVALESTLITHGLPYPANRDTALAMQTAVTEAGATPATIAIINGNIHIGLTDEEIDWLAKETNVRKCSRRDIPIAIGLKETAATTVAGTMIIAQMAGIRVFATGGIGGVHRGHPFDVSADLQELGRTPVTVVCSGAKSILDLPLTLEVLETQGVPILGYQTNSLPAFYTRESGLPIDARVESAEEIVAIMQAAQDLEAQHGILVTVPVPEAEALASEVAEKAITQATDEAEAQGIHGKEVTPFVLSRVVELTDGQSMRANRALLENNARIAGEIAKALHR